MERSESPKGGITTLFSKGRSRKGTSANNSIRSSGSDGVRASLEGAIDRLKGTDDEGESNGLKKLVSRGIGSKRRHKRQEREEEQRASEEVARGRSVAERGTLYDDARSIKQVDGDGSSLITYDSDPESREITPPLTTHASHTGYLTTSSPLINSTTLPDVIVADTQFDSSAPRASTFSVSADTLAGIESTAETNENTLRAPSNGSEKRSPSPVGRIKDAFKPRRGSSPNISPERKAGGGGVGSVKEKSATSDSRRGSVASRLGSIFPDRQPPPPPVPPLPVSSPERPKTAKVQTIDTNATPRTPPSDGSAPIIVNTPPTPTETSVPNFPSNRDRGISEPASTNSNVVTSASGNMISHRRIRSGSATLGPSKLSNITSVPLTPTPENGSITPGNGGFFSSVFSAAQNAANTLSNSIANTSVAPGGNKAKGSTTESKEVESPTVETFAEKPEPEGHTEEKELAVKTLGMGDLSLSALGISENSTGTNTPIGMNFPESTRGRSESTNDDSGRTVPATSSFLDNGEHTTTSNETDIQPLIRPRSVYGDQTPPNGSVFEGKSGIQRSGSIRSAIGNRRKRGSSAATGTTIGAAIAAANTSIANPSHGTPKITGFAVASKKRNRDFHQLFRSVPDDDYLIEDYSCALQREILAHGRLYVSEGHLCFSSNIFGWVTTLVMSFDEIVSVEKRSTALVFKNGLMISTLHAKNVFASFTSRDSTYDLIVGIWKLGHPSLRSSLNGVRIEETGGGDKTEKYDGPPLGSQSGSDDESDGEDGDEIYDEDEDDEDGMSFTQAEGSVAGSDVVEKAVARKPSAAVVVNGAPVEKAKEEGVSTPAGDFPGPATHAPTECTDQDTHYTKVLADEIIPAPLGKIYSLMFGPASITWMRNWLTQEAKCFDLVFEENAKKPLGLDNKVRNFSYIKPLNGSIGPKQTKCVCTETLESLDYDKAISVSISTATPDVPSGNVFSTKTKYCLMWGEGNTTRLIMNCTVEWTGKSWLKGPIEKGANDGQVQYAKDIIASLKVAVSSRRGTAVASGAKGKKKGRKGRESKSVGKTTDGTTDSKPTVENWGLLEPIHPILGPLVDIIKPLLTGNMMYGLLVGLLVASWFRFGFTSRGVSRGDLGLPLFGTPERIAAYEEMWRREESELWDWLEDRVGMDRLRDVGKMPLEGREMAGRLKDEKMEEREVDHAIRVTEEKLRLLKRSVEKQKARNEKVKEKSGIPNLVKEAKEKSEEILDKAPNRRSDVRKHSENTRTQQSDPAKGAPSRIPYSRFCVADKPKVKRKMALKFIQLLFFISFFTKGFSAKTSGCGKNLPSAQSPPGGPSHHVSFTQSDGTERKYLIHIPSTYDINTPVPLIFSFHGRTKNASEQEGLSQFSNEAWNPHAFAVYPQGLDNQWEGDPDSEGVDDIGFTSDMISHFSEKYCLDDSRIYAAGKSNGGGFTNILACDPVLSSQIAAFAPVSGAFYVNTPEAKADCDHQKVIIPCNASRNAIPILEFHGNADTTIPYNGNKTTRGCLPTIPHWVREWSKREGFGLTNKTTGMFGGKVLKYEYGGAAGKLGIVTHYLIDGLTHAWPSKEANDDSPNGTYIDATPIIMDFFGNYTL